VRSWAVVASCAALGIGAASCSLLTRTSADQCQAAADCAGFPGLRTCADGVCQAATALPACTTPADCAGYASATCTAGACVRTSCEVDADCGPTSSGFTCEAGKCTPPLVPPVCTKNADCAPLGQTSICRKDKGKCVDLLTTQCTTIVGEPTDDDAFVLGSVLPLQDTTSGIPIENALRLAINEINDNAGGLPALPGGRARPVALVGCDDGADSHTGVLAARHLVEDLGLQVVIGAAYSGITVQIAKQVTMPAKVMLFSPSATSAAITDLDDSSPRLVWRTSPSDDFQAKALSFWGPTVEASLEQADPTITQVRVAILHKGDSYGKGLASSLEQILVMNGAPVTDAANAGLYKRSDYGNPDDPAADPLKYNQVVADMVTTFKPHIAFLFGTDEVIADVFEQVEEQWIEPSYRPTYVFSDGGELQGLWQYVAAREAALPPPAGAATLRKRISGSVPGSNGALFNTFRSNYISTYSDGQTSPDVFGTAGGYDIVYMLAYAAAAAGEKPLTGPTLAASMAKLVPPGELADVGIAELNLSFTKLVAGAGIDFNGASGPLDFDLKKGEAPSDIQIWCVSKDGATGFANGTINSKIFYDAKAGKLIDSTLDPRCL
jgi:branched-chain amino acid transport system substrate-binding protein